MVVINVACLFRCGEFLMGGVSSVIIKAFSLFVFFFLVAFATHDAFATTITVNSLADNVTAGDGLCTLREAANNMNEQENVLILQKNGGLDTTGGDCPLGNGASDTIVLPAGTITLAIPCGADYTSCPLNPTQYDNDIGSIAISVPVTVTGAGISSTVINGAQLDQVFTFMAALPAQVTLKNLTLTGGMHNSGGGGASFSGNVSVTNIGVANNKTQSDSGGGLWAGSGTLTVTNSTFTGNQSGSTAAYFGGGAIYANKVTISNSTFTSNRTPNGSAGAVNGNNITITNSTLSGNSCAKMGGAINAFDSLINISFPAAATIVPATLTISKSVINGNSSQRGGGVYVEGDAVITNTTISGNSASIDGGAIGVTETMSYVGFPPIQPPTPASPGSLALTNVTVANNGGAAVSGIYSIGAGTTSTFSNSIVSGNNSTACADDGSGVTYTSGGFNAHGDATCLPTPTGSDMTTATLASLNLGALALNGGKTKTHALLAGSVAIDAGSCVSGTDQRGIARPQGITCDIGAFETFGGCTDPVATNYNPQATQDDGSCAYPAITITIKVTDGEGGLTTKILKLYPAGQ